MPKFAKIVQKGDVLTGEVIHVDSFGNIVTNFTEKELEWVGAKDSFKIKLKKHEVSLKLCRAYAEVKPQKPLAIIGSHDFLEISVNQGSAAETFHVKPGDKVTLYRSL